VRALFDGKNFAVLTTLEPDGSPHFDAANPYESAQLQGTASIVDDPDGVLVEELSQKYTGGPHPGFAGPNPRWATVRITVDKVTTTWPDA